MKTGEAGRGIIPNCVDKSQYLIKGTTTRAVSELAGKPAPKEIRIDPEQLRRDYFEKQPDPSIKAQRVRFGTGGHRGTPLLGTFTEPHIRAIVQAVAA